MTTGKPYYRTYVDSRGIKQSVYVAGAAGWREQETRELKQHRQDNYTLADLHKEGFQ